MREGVRERPTQQQFHREVVRAKGDGARRRRRRRKRREGGRELKKIGRKKKKKKEEEEVARGGKTHTQECLLVLVKPKSLCCKKRDFNGGKYIELFDGKCQTKYD